MLLPEHVGCASGSQMPGDVGDVGRLQWKPGWQPTGESSGLQHSCWSFWAQVGPGLHAFEFVVQQVLPPAEQLVPPHSSWPPLQVGAGIGSQTPGVPAIGWLHRKPPGQLPVEPFGSQQSCWVGCAHEAPPHWFGSGEQQTLGPHVVPPHATAVPLQVGGVTTAGPHWPGADERRLHWSPGAHVPCVPLASQQSSSVVGVHCAATEHALVLLAQQGCAPHPVPPHSTVVPLQEGGATICSHTPGAVPGRLQR
jgi:hypothetical protein